MDSPARVGRLRNRLAQRLSLIAKLLWAMWLVGAFLLIDAPPPHWAMSIWGGLSAGAVAGLAFMLLSWALSLFPRAASGHVTFHDGVLRLKQRRYPVAIDASDITSAHAQMGGVVEITTRAGDTWIIELADDAAATSLVSELGFAHGGKPVTYPLGSRFRRFLHLAVAYIAYQTGAMVGAFAGMAMAAAVNATDRAGGLILPMVVLGFFAVYAIGKRLIRAPVVTVGNDGVWLETTAFRKRFVPMGDIVMAHQATIGGPVRLKTRDGTVISMAGFIVDTPRRDAAAGHIRALLARHDALQTTSAAVLARDGRSVRDWRDHLRRVVEGSGYRTAATNDSLADLVSAPGIPPEQRVGAALALRVAGDDHLPRIRIAAEQCVDPKTRAALEAAAESEIDEQAIEKALR